jgi:alcohol dehydrogenase class IV
MRVLFGSGRVADLGAELDRLGIRRALILTTPHQKVQGDEIAAMVGDRAADLGVKNAYWNPRALERDVIARARDGERPKAEH